LAIGNLQYGLELKMSQHLDELKSFRPSKGFFVGIDSDGCAFDSMEIKHKECFIPNIVNYWDLQAISKFARQAAEFVNLYSKWRGINRFPALVMVLDLLAEWPAALERGYTCPAIDSLRDWIKRETALSNGTLEAEVKRTGDPVLTKTLAWSKAVNADVAKIVRNVPPFPHVRASLARLQGVADVIVVSATPGEALRREWQEHALAAYAGMILGQEQGSKKEHLQHTASGKYPPDHILMIGDAPGDQKAANAVGALFFPIVPGHEADAWRRLGEEGIARFLAGTYLGDYQDELVRQFDASLPSVPPWKKAD
jgi:phosphoglycolate phosphatase-like HAD superfamily hydrolase